MPPLLLVPDLEALKRKLEAPSPLLATCLARFRERLACDAAFRSHNLFLPALLGEAVAVAEARASILARAQDPDRLLDAPQRRLPPREMLDHHIWCVAPQAMRQAVYYTWLDRQGVWTPDERRAIGAGLLGFAHEYVIPVLRSRIPGGHNQQLSMTLCCAVTGEAFAAVEGIGERARLLRDWALPKLRQTLGLMPPSGYSCEGEAYQSPIVAPLVMWTGFFLEQLGTRDAWNQEWQPAGWRMTDTLRMEALLAGSGDLLPPWDNYGWQRVRNLAARAVWAGLSGDRPALDLAGTIWDEPHHLAWCPDDRLWTLLYWPQEGTGDRCQVSGEESGSVQCSVFSIQCSAGRATDDTRHAPPDTRRPPPASRHRACLSGWAVPTLGAAIEHAPRRLRVMAVWDRCSGSPQGVGRAQVNPNHLTLDLAGQPLTADGTVYRERGPLFAAPAVERTLRALAPEEAAMIARQYGTPERWLLGAQYGLLGASCSIIVDGEEGYFPRAAREGRLVFEQRRPERHTFAGEAAAFYQPAFDVTRMRRTVSVGATGVVWVVDDMAAARRHEFTWRLWLRRGARAVGAREARLELPSGVGVTLAWLAEADGARPDCRAHLADEAVFPAGWEGAPWPESGSTRCDVTVAGAQARVVTCLVPEGVRNLTVRAVGDGAWEAAWDGGAERFDLPPEIAAVPDLPPVTGEQNTPPDTFCDLDEPPFGLPGDSDEALLAALDDPPVAAWRRTGAAMQALTVRGVPAALPRILALLEDARQNYTVHAVAAGCLGRARYAPALELLRRIQHLPEVNAAHRARWAVERMEADAATPPQAHGGSCQAARMERAPDGGGQGR